MFHSPGPAFFIDCDICLQFLALQSQDFHAGLGTCFPGGTFPVVGPAPCNLEHMADGMKEPPTRFVFLDKQPDKDRLMPPHPLGEPKAVSPSQQKKRLRRDAQNAAGQSAGLFFHFRDRLLNGQMPYRIFFTVLFSSVRSS